MHYNFTWTDTCGKFGWSLNCVCNRIWGRPQLRMEEGPQWLSSPYPLPPNSSPWARHIPMTSWNRRKAWGFWVSSKNSYSNWLNSQRPIRAPYTTVFDTSIIYQKDVLHLAQVPKTIGTNTQAPRMLVWGSSPWDLLLFCTPVRLPVSAAKLAFNLDLLRTPQSSV